MPTRRGKWLNLPPGKGIIAKDLTQNQTTEESNTSLDESSSDESSKYESILSETSDDYNEQNISTPVQRKDISVDDFVLVKFTTKKVLNIM